MCLPAPPQCLHPCASLTLEHQGLHCVLLLLLHYLKGDQHTFPEFTSTTFETSTITVALSNHSPSLLCHKRFALSCAIKRQSPGGQRAKRSQASGAPHPVRYFCACWPCLPLPLPWSLCCAPLPKNELRKPPPTPLPWPLPLPLPSGFALGFALGLATSDFS